MAVLDWSSAREPFTKYGLAQARYPGIKTLGELRETNEFRLVYDGSHFSHQLAQKLGEHIAESLALFNTISLSSIESEK